MEAWRTVCIVSLLGSSALGALLSSECGYASANGQAFVINGRNATAGESPWHVGLYVDLMQVCGGSLVHPRVVVTAAHCLYSTGLYGKVRDPATVTISVGNSLREWSRHPSSLVQQRNVSKVVPHPRYRGRGRLFADDIGLLILEAPVSVSAYVLPVCMNGRGGERLTLSPGSVGKAVGWGVASENGTEPSPVLKAAELPFIPFEQCAEAVPSDFLPFLTHDKFCAGHVNGASVASGDSGGGLAFPRKGQWFLMGVVSVGVPSHLTYSAFTNVTAYLDWISDTVDTVENPAKNPTPTVDGNDCVAASGSKGVCTPLADCPAALEDVRNGGQPKVCLYSAKNPIVCCANPVLNATVSSTPVGTLSDSTVGLIARQKCQEYSRYVFSEDDPPADQCAVYSDWLIGDWQAQPREFPHMAMLGFGNESDITWPCGGSLISPEYVLTVAHCMNNRGDQVKWVRLGTLHLNAADSDDRPQLIAVRDRIPHPAYKPPQRYHNIGLLRLERPAAINGHVRPACLYTERTLRAGGVPVATGWGRINLDGQATNTLKKIGLPVADNKKCREDYPPQRTLPEGILDESMICAGGKGRDTCAGDSGGPLQVATRNTSSSTEPYCMHKVLGLTAFGKGCRTGAPGVYTRVSYYVPWIESVVWPPPPAVGRIAREKCQEYSRLVAAEDCGLFSISLIGDWEAQPKEFPHMAALGYESKKGIEWLAGGSLISPNFVLTTAVSVLSVPRDRSLRWVQLGSPNSPGDTLPSSGEVQRIGVREQIVHPDYKRPVAYNDIALLRLQRPASMTSFVRPACLHTEPAVGVREVPIATGWGAMEAGGERSSTLKKQGLPVVDHSTCKRMYQARATNRSLPRGIEDETQLCAGGKGRDTCTGDSGGPLQLATQNFSGEPFCMHKIVGLTSFGAPCGSGPPGVFTRVYHFVPWIESVVWPSTAAKEVSPSGTSTAPPRTSTIAPPRTSTTTPSRTSTTTPPRTSTTTPPRTSTSTSLAGDADVIYFN